PEVVMPPPGLTAQETVVPPPPELPSLELSPTAPPSHPPPAAYQETSLAYAAEQPPTFAAADALTQAEAPPFPEPAAAAAPAAPPSVSDGGLAAVSAPPRPRRGRGGWHIALVIIPLISYSILASLVAYIFWSRWQKELNRPHPLEMVPDIEGDSPTKKK